MIVLRPMSSTAWQPLAEAMEDNFFLYIQRHKLKNKQQK